MTEHLSRGSDPSDYVTINEQHVKRQLESLMQMSELDAVEALVQGQRLWLNGIREMCVCLCQPEPFLVCYSHRSLILCKT